KVSALFALLPTHLADATARLHAIAENSRLAKEHHYAIDADMLQDWAQFAAPAVFGLAVRAYSALRLAEKHRVVHNLLVSNVPGPPMPLYLLGARITGMYPLGPVLHGAGLNITVMSHDGRVSVGIRSGAQFAAPAVFGLAVRAYSALRLAEKHRVVHNLLVSNVPGPPMPLYLLGARITGMYPLGPVLHGAGLNITVMSHDGRVSVGI